MRIGHSAILIGLIGIFATACGSTAATATNTPSSSPGSASTADAICASYNTQIGALAPPSNPSAPADASALPALASWLDQVQSLALQEQTALQAASDASPINSSFGVVITKLQALDAVAKGTDVGVYTTAYTDFTTATTTFHAAATAANLPNCAK